MGDLFVILGIACMCLWLWGQLSTTQQDTIRETTKSVSNSAKEQIHKVTK